MLSVCSFIFHPSENIQLIIHSYNYYCVKSGEQAMVRYIYTKIMNERAMLNVMKETDARSFLECASHCTITHGCRRAQWGTSGCELLTDAALGETIELGHEDKAIYMCKLLCFLHFFHLK